MAQNVAFVAGASGVVGASLSEAMAQSGNWHVIGCARRIPAQENRIAGVDYAAVDLSDLAACRQIARDIKGVTHLFYAARAEFTTGKHESADINTVMFRNILDALEAGGHALQHVHMVHGTKYYGSTEGRFPTPAREDAPRCMLSNFYYDQEDIVLARTGSRRWSWSSSRPHGICDSTLATPRSMPLLIATFAAISRQLGQPLSFPGTPGNYRAIYQCTDARLLARAILWMATEPRCADQAFNVTNGDFVRWENLWPVFARYFGMELGPVKTINLAASMPVYAAVWRDVVTKHALVDTPYERMALWSYGDFIFTPDWDMMSSTTKLRQFGFHDVVDTEQMFLEFFDDFRRRRIIAPATAME
jgi:nucleoside-diphosphate-sugar epimerase